MCIGNISPWQNQVCKVWPWSQIATCTVCLHHTAVLEAVRGIYTDRSAWAHPLDRMPGLFWWTQQTTHVSQGESNSWKANWSEYVCLHVVSRRGQPKESAEVLSTAGRPGEDPVISSQSGRHNVTLCLATRVPFAIMDHPKTGDNVERKKRLIVPNITSKEIRTYHVRCVTVIELLSW